MTLYQWPVENTAIEGRQSIALTTADDLYFYNNQSKTTEWPHHHHSIETPSNSPTFQAARSMFMDPIKTIKRIKPNNK